MLFWSVALSAFLFFSVVVVAVLTRYVLKTPILASIELSRLFFVWSCFLAAALTYRRRAHVGFELLYERFPAGARTAISMGIYVLIIAFSSLLVYQGLIVNRLLWLTDLPMLQWSQSWFFVPVPLVGLFFILYTLEFMMDHTAPPGESTRDADEQDAPTKERRYE